ncbi:MAG: FtsX-like permease family protein [bacterium]
MFKNMFKRTWLSLKRKPNKSIVMVLLMFVMANLVLASLLIKSAVSENITAIKESLGSEIYLSTDTEAIMSLMQSESSNMDMSADRESGGKPSMNMIRPEITLDMVLEIGTSDYVRDLTYSTTTYANASDFSIVEEDEEEQSGMMQPDRDFGQNQISGDILIQSINAYSFISEVTNGTMSIVDGTYFDESTDNMVMISYELSVENDLEVGDSITLINVEDESEYTLEIIGIFLTTDSGYENTVYMNIQTATDFFVSSQITDNYEYIVSNVIYYLSNPEYVDLFLEEANEKYPNLEELYLTLDINNQAYEQMAGSIEQVADFANTILIVVISASVLIISLLINNNVKDRKYEIGVLRALGATKSNVAGQIFAELLATATLGFVLSFSTSYFLAQSLSDSLLQNEIESTEVNQEQSFGRPSSGSTGGAGNMAGNFSGGMNDNTNNNQLLDVDVVDEIDISVSIGSYVLLFVIGYTISFIAMIIPTRNIVKYEPKSILTGRE